ncbi:MAG: hypothetical protein KBE23_21990 [Chloroflexi bacterium]|nr:hypothetical protein [Chloroflexota bacterium]MBP7045437.1 hypothetical protein [Chloroflexota bacterium]
MILSFHGLRIELYTPDAPIMDAWAHLFSGWPETAAVGTGQPDILLELHWRESLPPLPDAPPIFTDQNSRQAAPAILTAYAEPNGRVALHFHEAGLVSAPLTAPLHGETQTAVGVITPASLANGRFEDITFTTLAPMLRRRGYFLLHAFAVAKNGRAALLVGASGSGKTTSGLSLVLNGWELLSNDVVALQARPEGIFALPVPDMVSIRPFTFHLLPELARQLGSPPATNPINIPAGALTNGRWAKPALVTAVYFPMLDHQATSAAIPLSRAVCLARLMEQSIDQWDTAVLADHMNALQTLSRQAAPYTLHLAKDVYDLPSLIQV